MVELLDRLTHAGGPVAQRENLARKIKTLSRAEMFDPRMSRIYYSEISELPDTVKNHPAPAQRAYMATFNNLLRKTGDQSKAMRGAAKALRNKLEQLRDARRRERRVLGFDDGRVAWDVNRLVRGPKVQIVVP